MNMKAMRTGGKLLEVGLDNEALVAIAEGDGAYAVTHAVGTDGMDIDDLVGPGRQCSQAENGEGNEGAFHVVLLGQSGAYGSAIQDALHGVRQPIQ